MGRHRPWLAAVLAVLVAGLGHAYLRRWRRAVLWFTAILGTGVVLSMTVVDPATLEPMEFPPQVTVPLVVVYGLSALDAFRVARSDVRSGPASVDRPRSDATAGDPTCPHCGKSVDPDLDFCTWCTEPLAPDESPGG